MMTNQCKEGRMIEKEKWRAKGKGKREAQGAVLPRASLVALPVRCLPFPRLSQRFRTSGHWGREKKYSGEGRVERGSAHALGGESTARRIRNGGGGGEGSL